MMQVLKRFSSLFWGILIGVTGVSCESEIEEIVTKKSIVMPNGMHLEIEKTDIETKNIGIFSKHNYGTNRSFKYKLYLDEADVLWDFGVGEPKHFLFSKDDLYIHFLNKNTRVAQQLDSVTNIVQENKITGIENLYQKHIDKRYFFKLFGEDFWVDVDEEEYITATKTGEEFPIPNDNEFSLHKE